MLIWVIRQNVYLKYSLLVYYVDGVFNKYSLLVII